MAGDALGGGLLAGALQTIERLRMRRGRPLSTDRPVATGAGARANIAGAVRDGIMSVAGGRRARHDEKERHSGADDATRGEETPVAVAGHIR